MARKAKKRIYTVRMTRATMAALRMVSRDERRALGDVIDRAISRYLDIKDNLPEDRSS